MRKQKQINVYLVSDSSGETVIRVANAVLAQFNGLHVNKFMWPMVRTETHIDTLVASMKVMPGVIIYTIVDDNIERYLLDACEKHSLNAISVLGGIIDYLGNLFSIHTVKKKPGLQHKVSDKSYNMRIAALDYTLAHDDGQKQNDVDKADIVIIGVSRTSKSPTSLYLAQRGFKTSNIPFIKGIGVDLDCSKLKQSLVVGLTINAEKLKSIRETRLNSLTMEREYVNNYTDLIAIKEEIIEARQFFERNDITVIDVSNRAIEETAAEIINLYHTKFGITARTI
jgi:regulator of PEP synthase PpsR (kinase-PPPase family)